MSLKTLKGSQQCLRDWVENRGLELATLIVNSSPGLTAFRPVAFAWKSPLPCEGYHEYRDRFWTALGLTEAQGELLGDFWPAGGPRWDGLAVLQSADGEAGYLLVEAKAHLTETVSSMREDVTHESQEKIRAALNEVKGYMEVPPAFDWTTGAYQLANRLAFLYCMQVRLGLPTWLALVNFENDETHIPTPLRDWRKHYQGLFAGLGLGPGAPLLEQVVLVFPPGQ